MKNIHELGLILLVQHSVMNIVINLHDDSLYSKQDAIKDLLKLVEELNSARPYVNIDEAR